MNPLLALLKRDLLLSVREGGALGTALGFFMIVVALMPLGLGPDLKLLTRIAPGVLWIALLLSALLSLGRMFEDDAADGSLDTLALADTPLELVCAVKALVHWLTTGIPLALATPVLGLLLNLDLSLSPVLVGSLLLGTPAISFLGCLGAALTLNARKGGLLIALLVLPLYIPTLIFGIGAIAAVLTPPGSLTTSLLMLAAISLMAIVVGPFAAAAAIRAQRG